MTSENNSETNQAKAFNKTDVITRFFKELFNKSLKCERLGHKIKTLKIRIRKRSDGYGICTDFKAKKDYCERCGKFHTEPYELKELTTYTSVSMPNSSWDSSREKGYAVMD
jgi:hypothetical protein